MRYVDVRDLAAFLLDAAYRRRTGAYNVVGPPGQASMGELLDTCAQVTGSGAVLRWVGPEQVAAAGVRPWTDLPIWLPPGLEHTFMHGGDVGRAVAAGLRCRPMRDTVVDTWAWLRTIGGRAPQRPDRPAPGLTAQAETRLLMR